MFSFLRLKLRYMQPEASISSAAKDTNTIAGFPGLKLKYVEDLLELLESSSELCAIRSLKSRLQFPFPAFIMSKLLGPLLLTHTFSCRLNPPCQKLSFHVLKPASNHEFVEGKDKSILVFFFSLKPILLKAQADDRRHN